MVYKIKVAKKASDALLVCSVLIALGVALSCYTVGAVNSIALKSNKINSQELDRGLNFVFSDADPSIKLSDNSTTTTTETDDDDTAPYPGDGNDNRWMS